MSKALDLVRLLINGANEYEKETGNKNPTVYLSRNNLLVIEKALLKAQEPKQYVDELKLVEKKLKRLEAIDNANPSEALECLEKLPYTSQCYGNWKEYTTTIKQALLKAEEPKQYLKWEDLKFEHTPKMFDVKMNDNKYRLVVGYNVAGNNLVILRNDKQQYYFLEADKQFFNDLHLERVEEE